MPRYQKRQPQVKSTQPQQRDPYTQGRIRPATPSQSSPCWRMLVRYAEDVGHGAPPSVTATATFLQQVSRCSTRIEKDCLLGLGADLFGYDLDEAREMVEVMLLEAVAALDGGRA
jgi:hypothetical protein